MTGIRTASTDSSIFSIMTEFPLSIENSMSLLMFLEPKRTQINLLTFSFSLIHQFPYNYGSIINGYLPEFVRIVPFSIETASEGRPSLFHPAI
jgi:hypothetical protein